MVEMLVAVTIIVVALLGILALLNRSLGLNRVAAEQYTAAYLASEGIELVKNLFDRSYIQTLADYPGSQNFYGWFTPYCIIPNNCSLTNGNHGVYEMDYTDSALNVTNCSFGSGSEPTQSAVRDLIFSSSCSLRPLMVDPSGYYNYDLGNPTKFYRVIIIDRPAEYPEMNVDVNLDYRVTSAVGWQSKGGKFVVQLQDHFLPWRIP